MRFFLCCLLLVMGVAACDDSNARQNPMETRERSLASMPLSTLDGKKASLEELHGHKPLVLNVWATWCPPCVKELPSLLALQKSGKFNVVTLATDRQAETVRAFLEKHNLTDLNVLWDRLGKGATDHLGPLRLPQTYIFTADFTFKTLIAGERDWNSPAMEEKIKRALSK